MDVDIEHLQWIGSTASWAGSRLRRERPLRVGIAVARRSRVADVDAQALCA